MKPKRTALSLVIKNEADNFLVVKRPDNPADSLAGVWGFPAVTLKDGESDEAGADRVAAQKLGTEIELGNKLGTSTHDRGSYELTLTDYEARVIGETPSVPQPDHSVTQYTECKFTDDVTLLFEAARKGSLCTKIFLESVGANWRED